MKLNADLTLRATANTHQLEWETSPASGVCRLRLECDEDHPPVERVTTVVNFAPGSAFPGHVHGGGEEFYVLAGTFSDQHADFPAGYYVRNPKGTGHAPHSNEGCTILVKLWQMHPDDRQQLAIDTRDENLWQQHARYSRLPLFDADYEQVDMLELEPGFEHRFEYEGGVEYFVLEGAFDDDQGNYTQGSWLRLPAGSNHRVRVTEPCRVWRKQGHLLQPVSYLEP
ncbi:cupin domain-containing protein [Thiohalophilus sp.]|uniref:cupin domain-containing protein n=1 Tax=Thiohalophilus sp. TaxID=3028392 RepID=UPI003975852C